MCGCSANLAHDAKADRHGWPDTQGKHERADAVFATHQDAEREHDYLDAGGNAGHADAGDAMEGRHHALTGTCAEPTCDVDGGSEADTRDANNQKEHAVGDGLLAWNQGQADVHGEGDD